MSTLPQRLSVSALLVANEAMVESGRLPADEELLIRKIMGAVRESFEETPPRLPTLIIADPGFDEPVERITIEAREEA